MTALSLAASTPANHLDERKRKKKASEVDAIKLIPKLIEAARWGHKERIAEVGEQIAVSLEASHPAISSALRVGTAQQRGRPMASMPVDLVEIEEPRHGLDAVVLPDPVRQICDQVLQEHQRHVDLQASGLTPRHKILLHGAPRNGKTLLAEALAKELAIPFLRVKYGGLLAGVLGQTGRHIEQIMEYARTAPCLVFLDEIDSVGLNRGTPGEVGELRRVTNQLLITMERLPAYCVFVAATNSVDLIDDALKRRFDVLIELPAPTKDLMRRCAAKELDPALTPGKDLRTHIEAVVAMRNQNLYDVVETCRRLRRDYVLNNGAGAATILAAGCPVPTP